MEPWQHCIVVDTVDKGELVVAYNHHMEDNTDDDDIGQVEAASLDGDNVALAASLARVCSPLTQKVRQEDRLGLQ